MGVGIVGTGVVSDQHVAALRGESGVEIVAATDFDATRGRDAAERWGRCLRRRPQSKCSRAGTSTPSSWRPPGRTCRSV